MIKGRVRFYRLIYGCGHGLTFDSGDCGITKEGIAKRQAEADRASCGQCVGEAIYGRAGMNVLTRRLNGSHERVGVARVLGHLPPAE